MKPIFTFLSILLAFAGFSQNLPREFYFSNDGRQLLSGGKPAVGIYDETKIPVIKLTFAQSNYWSQMQTNYSSKTDILANMTIDGAKYDSVGVRFKGQTSYSMNRNSEKLSFNISLDFKKSEQKVDGYKTLNLNNAFQDASFMREVFYYHNIRRHSLATKANFVHLYINDQDWGIYQNVQQQNKDFLKEWFLDNGGSNWRAEAPSGTTGGGGGMGGGGGGFGAGSSSLNYFDDDTTTYKKYYTLQSSEQKQPWQDFPAMTKALNKTDISKLEEEVSKYLDVDRTLWHLASENLFSDDDSYINKGGMDYYLTHETTTNRYMTYDYDGNSVMSSRLATWSPFYNDTKTTQPLTNRLLASPTARQRYLAHLRTLITEYFDEKNSSALLDKYAAMIDEAVKADPKKGTTYAQFQPEVNNLKTFITNRRNALLGNAEVKEVAPAISETAFFVNNTAWQRPTENEATTIRTKVSNTASQVFLYYGTGIYSRFTKIEMFDDGKNDDGASKDGVFGAKIPKQAAANYVRYYIEAVGNNTAKSVSYAPVGAEHDVYIYQVQGGITSVAPNSNVVINEVVASNKTGAKDEKGEYEDWIELYNKSESAVDIGGYFLTDDNTKPKKWTIPSGTKIDAKGYLIIWADEDETQGKLHTNFKLSADGEFLYLLNPQVQLADSVSFGLQQNDMAYARNPNGTGKFKVQATTYNSDNEKSTSGGTGGTGGGTGGTGGSAVLSTGNPSEFAIKIMPNPTEQEVKIRLEGISKNTKISILNLLGNEVYSADYQEDMSISLKNFQAGTYFVRSENLIKKLIIQ